MEENPSRVSRKNGCYKGSSRRGPTRNDCRCPAEDASGDLIECSGKHCRSCTGGMIADCVALCCCPCAVVSFFTLAFFKAPWMMGRRCLGLEKKKKEKKRKCEGEIDGNSRNSWVEVEISEIGTGLEDGQEIEGNLSARFEAERVWLELYQLGHLGFGRVSYTGIPPQDIGLVINPKWGFCSKATITLLLGYSSLITIPFCLGTMGKKSSFGSQFLNTGAADRIGNWVFAESFNGVLDNSSPSSSYLYSCGNRSF